MSLFSRVVTDTSFTSLTYGKSLLDPCVSHQVVITWFGHYVIGLIAWHPPGGLTHPCSGRQLLTNCCLYMSGADRGENKNVKGTPTTRCSVDTDTESTIGAVVILYV